MAGNGYTSPVRVREMSLLRAAELTEQAGYNYFIILDFVDDLRVSSYTTAGSSTTSTTGSATAMGSTVFGSATSQTTYQPPTTQTVTKPLTDIVVRFVPDEHAAEASALSVQQVYGMYAGKYGLN